ncbi:MAG: vanadium nitrogenase [Lachnospiraceae bacterium]|nr:vanadium nitrogenase [Lachnospiraceae bacterium]MCR5407423.1 vanadium nitrogenase [Lachnospiraceae bacterium]
MVSFFNSFISYLLLVVIMVAVAICGGFTGKKLRDRKNAKEAANAENEKQE